MLIYRRFILGKKEKLIARLKSKPKDFTLEEAETLLAFFSYFRSEKGKTSGSRIMFVNKMNHEKILLHKPHPGNELREYQIRQLIEHLSQEGLI